MFHRRQIENEKPTNEEQALILIARYSKNGSTPASIERACKMANINPLWMWEHVVQYTKQQNPYN